MTRSIFHKFPARQPRLRSITWWRLLTKLGGQTRATNWRLTRLCQGRWLGRLRSPSPFSSLSKASMYLYSSSVSGNKDRPLCDTGCRENVLEGAQLPLATHWSGLSCSSLLSLPLLSREQWHHLEFSFDERRSCSFRLRSWDRATQLNAGAVLSLVTTLCSMTTSLVRKSTCALYPTPTNIACLLYPISLVRPLTSTYGHWIAML